MTTSTRFPSEPGPQLVPRLVKDWREPIRHICMARVEFAHGAIVTLQALCGDWSYGLVIHANILVIVEQYPAYSICPDCLERWRALSS